MDDALAELGIVAEPNATLGSADSLADLARSGVMGLCGPGAGPPVALVTPLLSSARSLMAAFDQLAEDAGGRATGLDGVRLLVERARLSGLGRRGSVSAGGRCRMVRAADGAVAVSLARDADVELVAAWLRCSPGGDPWATVASEAAGIDCAELVDRAELLGLPVAALGPALSVRMPVGLTGTGTAPPRPVPSLRVVDFSAMWAGPLCGRLLAAAGAQVVKVESPTRPDALRRGDPALYRRLNGAKPAMVVELHDRNRLAELVGDADVVIDASRPRAFSQLGVDVEALAAEGRTWVSITGYGRGSNRVAFGDDAAVAGGAWVDGGGRLPWFVGDALADPLAGLYAAIGALLGVARGGRVVDVAMAASVAHALGGRPPAVARGAVVTRGPGGWRMAVGGLEVPVVGGRVSQPVATVGTDG